MEEILELRRSVEEGRYNDALTLIGEMEEMAKEDKINKIGSYIVILLIHCIKNHAEKRMTRSWRNSILNALDAITETNTRKLSSGFYMNQQDVRNEIEHKFPQALRRASEETLDGKYEGRELAQLIDTEAIKAQALDYILNGYPESED
jgi:Domain of unknown function DUF29